VKYICLGYIEDKYFGGPTAAVIGSVRAQNPAGFGLDDRGREHRSLASLYRVVAPTLKPQKTETL
jgi:hypothetical protein